MTSATKKISAKKSLVDLLQSNTCKKHNQQKEILKVNSKSRCKRGASKQKKQADQMKSLLKQSYLFLKEENEMLHQKLCKKGKKIEELKQKIKDYDAKLSVSQQTIRALKENSSQIIKHLETDETLRSSRKKYEQMIRQSQNIAKQSIQKYKKLQKQIQQQKASYEQQILLLKKGNDTFRQIIQGFKSSEKSLHNISGSKRKANSSHKLSQDTQLTSQLKELSTLRKKQQQWSKKEQQLKNMLRQLANKLSNLEISCRMSDQSAKNYKIQLNSMQQKYQTKSRKFKQNNQKWASIFKQLMKEMQCVGKEIQSTKKIFVSILKKELALHQIQ